MRLKRISIVEQGAFGVLTTDEGIPVCVTLERTYSAEGSQFVKVPTGRLVCLKSRYNKGGYDSYEVIVPGHSQIKFHKGNVEANSEGCILCGRRFGRLGGVPAVLDSASGFDDFMAAAGGAAQFALEVS